MKHDFTTNYHMICILKHSLQETRCSLCLGVCFSERFLFLFSFVSCTAFEYNNDSVLVVNKYDYYHCNTTEPITAFNDGNSAVVKLDRPGPFYFISGAPDHCNNGQRLLVDVMSPHGRHPSPPSVAFPPETDKQGPSPSTLPSSGVVVSATLSSVFRVLIAGFVTFLWSAL